jgi:hypothetical protein
VLVAGVAPAAFEAGAVIGEHAFDLDAVAAVEACAGSEERDCGVAALVGVDPAEAEPGRVVDRDEEVLPAGTARPITAVAGDAVAGLHDPAELLHVDVQELAGPLALVTHDLLPRRGRPQPRATVPPQDRMHRRGGNTGRPPDQMRAQLQLGTRPQHRLLDRLRCAPGRAVRPRGAIRKSLAAPGAVDPFRTGLT